VASALELEALLDEAAHSRGLAAELAQDIPLVLADPVNHMPADVGRDHGKPA
jgi:hypothetical protein